MHKFFDWLDWLAQTNRANKPILWLERIAFVFLILMVLSAPHSIAATQIAWLSGMLAWIIRLFIKPRPKLRRTPLDIALWAFFGWSVITSVFSYAPDISLDKLRGAAIFLIFYFVIYNLRSARAACFLALALVFSCMVNVVWVPIERAAGRGVEISGVRAESPLAKALFIDGDTLLKANDRKIATPEDLLAEIEKSEFTRIEFYRPDFYYALEVKKADLIGGSGALERLGIAGWKKSRNWRSTGFFNHWTTYAEVLQLIASLAFGLFIASLKSEIKSLKSKNENLKTKLKHLPLISPLLFLCLLGMALALLLSITRASQLGFLISAFVICLLGASRKTLFTLTAIALPVVLLGLVFLQQSRQVGFFDLQDDSTAYRQTVYREGLDLWTQNARHFFLGVGMDSIKRYAPDWHLFDDGRLPMGHFHSTPLQLVVERGLPALILWIWILWLYARMLWRGIKIRNEELKIQNLEVEEPENSKSRIRNPKSADWQSRGILLGCLGGLIGFFASGAVHYNLGDQEIMMVFFVLMGLSVFLCGDAMKNDES